MVLMKNTSLSLTEQKSRQRLSPAEACSLFLPALPLTVGFWAMAAPILQISIWPPVFLSLAAIGVTLWIGQSPHRRRWTLVLLGLALALSLLLYRPLQDSLGEVLNRISLWLTQETGIYHLPYRTEGNILPMVIAMDIAFGIFAGIVVQCRNPFRILLLLFPLLPAAAGIQAGSWGLGLYLLGIPLLLAVSASGTGKSLISATLIAGILAGIFGGIFSAVHLPDATEAGKNMARFLHQKHYEQISNPMPEGNLQDLPAYTPSNEAALEVTMEHWTCLYIRGYVGSVYTSHGWEPLDTQVAAQHAQALYALQTEGFFPALQLDAGWQETDTACENSVTVTTLGACRAYTYLPYGVGALTGTELNPAQLVGEGTLHPKSHTLSAPIWPVENSYLLQEALSNQEDSPYLQAEALYRDWVYDTFLSLPEETAQLLQGDMDQPLSTTQAKAEITRILDQLLTYQENAPTYCGDSDFASYVLHTSPKGYSVHYATLATLLMRSCGIPARYVEGYVVTPQQAEVMNDGETLILRQTNSHAWCEYYLDGVGWLPFDATPGYTDILDYQLPDNGIPSESDQGSGHLQLPEASEKPHDKPLQVDKQPEPDGLSHWIYIRQALCLFGLLLLLALAALLVRTWILRRRILKKKAHFSDSDPRTGTGYILCYCRDLLELLGLPPKNLPLTQRQEELEQILHDQAHFQEISCLSNEIWFSNHPISEQQRQTALQWLSELTAIWQKSTPPVKRWLLRWLHCRVI